MAHGPEAAAGALEDELHRKVDDALGALRALKQGYAHEVNFGTEWADARHGARDEALWEAADRELGAILARLEAFEADHAMPHVLARRAMAEEEAGERG